MTKAKAIELLDVWINWFAKGGSEGPDQAALEKIKAELEGVAPIPVQTGPQEYVPKCDWCGHDLGMCAISGPNGAAYCSVPCSITAEDHKKLAKLVEWQKAIMAMPDH